MKRLISFETMKDPLSIPWIYEDYSPVPDAVILNVVRDVLGVEPRIFYLSENVVADVKKTFLTPDPDRPGEEYWTDPYENESDVLVNMPFESVILEAGSGLVQLSTDCPLFSNEMFNHKGRGERDYSRGMVDHQFGSIAFRELSPGSYVGFGVLMGIVESPIDLDFFKTLRFNGQPLLFKDNIFMAAMPLIDRNHEFGTWLSSECRNFTRAFFDKLKGSYAVGKERVPARARVGGGKQRRLVRVKNILHVAMKKERKSYSADYGKKINWSHRWEVMGHWRKVSTVGKDRAGNYTIKGFTWVVPHEKGAKNKPVIKKLRVIHAETTGAKRVRQDV